MDIQSFYEADTGTWTHLLADPASGAAAIIDPVWVFDPVSGLTDDGFIGQALAVAESRGYRIEWVLETHAHADHLSAAELVRARTGARVACGQGIRQVQRTFAPVFAMDGAEVDGSQFDRLLREGDILQLGGLEIRVIETPGHTADSISYCVGDAVFCGDTLFAPGYGSARCDFPGGSAGRLYDSIQRLHALPADTRIFLCHDYPKDGADPVCSVTVADSRSGNVHVHDGVSREAFVEMRESRDAKLGLPRLIIPSLQVNILAGREPEPEPNGVAYLRIPFNRPLNDLVNAHSRAQFGAERTHPAGDEE